MKKKEPRNSISKPEFIRKIAERANFTITDTKIFWRTVEEIFQEAVESGTELNLIDFGHLSYTTIKARTQKNPRTLEVKDFPEAQKVYFRLSDNYTNVLRARLHRINK
jgi:nucleoid DNA-binding protein